MTTEITIHKHISYQHLQHNKHISYQIVPHIYWWWQMTKRAKEFIWFQIKQNTYLINTCLWLYFDELNFASNCPCSWISTNVASSDHFPADSAEAEQGWLGSTSANLLVLFWVALSCSLSPTHVTLRNWRCKPY